MLSALDDIVERRIREAQQRGDFDHLPGTGKPLVLDDDLLVPEELRAANRVLKNAGFVPPEVEALRSVDELMQVVEAQAAEDAEERSLRRAQRKMMALAIALERRGTSLTGLANFDYRLAILKKLAASEEPGRVSNKEPR